MVCHGHQVGGDVRGEYTGINLGISLSMSADGSRIAIGAPTYNGQANRIGLIQIFDWNGTDWIKQLLSIYRERSK